APTPIWHWPPNPGCELSTGHHRSTRIELRKGIMEDLRIGVIGYGMRGGLTKHAHHPGEGSHVTLVAEPTERGRADARKAFGDDIAMVDDEDALLERADELDAVMVMTPDFNHASIALKTLAAGLPTFVEKPMGITTEQCRSEERRVGKESRSR